MAQDIVIRGNTYNDTPAVEIPRADGQGDALFYDTSDATITGGGQMLDGVISYGASGKVTGSIPTKTSANLSASGATVTAQAGYYATSASKSVANGSAKTPATSITANPTITISSGGLITASVSASQSVTPTVTAGYVSSGTAGNSSVSLSASVTTKGATNHYATTSDQTIASGTYLTGTQTIKALSQTNLTADNIKSGTTVTINNGNTNVWSVLGTYTGGGGSSKNAQTAQSTSRSTSSTYTEVISLTCTKAGTYHVYWSTFRSSTSGTWGSQLYINDNAYGTARTGSWSNHIQNIHLTSVSLSANDDVAVRVRSRGSNYYGYVGTLTIIEA